MSKKIAAALVFVLAIQCLSLLPLNVEAATIANKIDKELQTIMETISEDEAIPVAVWMEDIEHDEIEREADAYRYRLISDSVGAIPAKEVSALRTYQMSNANQKETVDEEIVHQITDEYITYKRNAHAETYLSANTEKLNSLLSENIKSRSRISVRAIEEVEYISKYSPVIFMNLTADQVFDIASATSVTAICYNSPVDDSVEQYTTEYSSSEENDSPPADLSEYRFADALNIKIGMIESGVPKNINSSFNASKLHYDDALKDENGEVEDRYMELHACQVASVLVGVEDGIVPEADLYCTTLDRPGEWQAGIEWLLSQGVNVINISCAIGGPSSGYGFASMWLDHIALQHSVHIVIAVGNVRPQTGCPETVITQGAYAYNVIAVGGVNAETNEVEAQSNYSATRYKPDLCAPATVDILYGNTDSNHPNIQFVLPDERWKVIDNQRGIVGGTSFAAPIVTAVVAQLCKQSNTLKLCQDLTKSLLLSSTKISEQTSNGGTLNTNVMCTKLGAGVLDVDNLQYVYNYGRYRNSYFSATTPAGEVYTRTFEVTSSDNFIRVALAWLNNVRLQNDVSHESPTTPSGHTLEILQLTIIGPDGSYWTSYDTTGNVQLLAFDPRIMGGVGTYTIQVTRLTDYDTKIYFGLSWY